MATHKIDNKPPLVSMPCDKIVRAAAFMALAACGVFVCFAGALLYGKLLFWTLSWVTGATSGSFLEFISFVGACGGVVATISLCCAYLDDLFKKI